MRRYAGRGVRFAFLAAFAVFFTVPLIWLILAPTKSDAALVTGSPFSFGSFHQVALAWDHLDSFSDHIYRKWIGNSLLYALSATAIVLVTAIPAGGSSWAARPSIASAISSPGTPSRISGSCT